MKVSLRSPRRGSIGSSDVGDGTKRDTEVGVVVVDGMREVCSRPNSKIFTLDYDNSGTNFGTPPRSTVCPIPGWKDRRGVGSQRRMEGHLDW